MAEDSKIEWTDHTFNPWEGCTKVSPGCANCYAEARNHRWGNDNWGKGKPRRRTSESNWKMPLKWNRFPLGRVRPRVFCASLADWLDDEVPIEWLADLLKLIHDTPNLDWLLLTKRPENFHPRMESVWDRRDFNDPAKFIALSWSNGHPVAEGRFDVPHNVWIGTTVEDNARAAQRIPQLLKIPARVRFLSCEPLLESVVLSADFTDFADGIHWVICGGESGRGKRPFEADWARALRDQCTSHGVPFFMKQMDKVQPIPPDLMVREWPAVAAA